MSTATAFRKKPVVINAVQFNPGVNDEAILAHLEGCTGWHMEGQGLAIPTLEGTMHARPGDYIIRGVKGEYYPCKPDIFEATYDTVGEPEEEIFSPQNSAVVYYGPHECGGCGRKIVRSSFESGGHKFDVPEGPIYPNTDWQPHECDHSAPAPWLPLSATTPDSGLEPVPGMSVIDHGEGEE